MRKAKEIISEKDRWGDVKRKWKDTSQEMVHVCKVAQRVYLPKD